MIRRPLQTLTDIPIHPRIRARRSHNLVKQIGTDSTRARISEQLPPWRQQLQRQAIDILISPSSPIGMRRSRRKLRRIQHNGIKLNALLNEQTQRSIHIRIHERGARQVKTIQQHIGLGIFNRRPRRINRSDMRSTPRQSRHTETAGVAITIEHTLKLPKQRVLVKAVSAIALI